MANLNFKWGLHRNLPASLTEAQIGSLFFTKDEGSLYLGIEAGKKPQRIQGVVQYYEDLTQFKSNVLPPYSEDIIYYIASESALVKWSGKKVAEDGTTKTSGEFTVLNVTASEFTDAVNNLNTSIAGNATNIGVNASNITGLRTDLGTNDKTDTTAFLRIKALEEAVDALEKLTGTGGAGNSLTERIKALEDWKAETAITVSSLVTDVAKNVQDIGKVAQDLADNYYTKTEADNKHTDLENTLREELTSHINAANALVYVGGITTATEWNTIKTKDASIGHTYVVAASGLNLNINGVDTTCYAGDLLIATGTEADNVIPAANIEWVHVKAGYNESLASTMRVIDGDEANTHKKATVQLSSYSGAAINNHGDLGKFSIISDSDNLEVKVNGEDVTVSMVWGSF